MQRTVSISLTLLLLSWIAACSDDSTHDPVTQSIKLPDVNISGTGIDRIGVIEITDGTGYCYIEGDRIPAVIYRTQFWETYGLNVFHMIAPVQDELNVIYLYAVADTLQTIWHESYSLSLDYENASGSAVYSGKDISTIPNLQCLEAVPHAEELVSGLTISGAKLNWSAGSGSIEIEDQPYALYPFQIVDCRDCGSSAADGWYEVHAVFHGQQDEMVFGILYFFIDEPGWVNLHYRIQLCDVRLGASTIYEADWELDNNILQGIIP